jgi:hypothetical protein
MFDWNAADFSVYCFLNFVISDSIDDQTVN